MSSLLLGDEYPPNYKNLAIINLRKSFSNTCTYWILIFKRNDLFLLMWKWQFTRNEGNEVKGKRVRNHASIESSLDAFKRCIVSKVKESEYIIDSIEVSESEYSALIYKAIDEARTEINLESIIESGGNIERYVKFKRLQAKRKATAKW